MTLSEWNQLYGLIVTLWPNTKMPDVKQLQLSLPVVEGVSFDSAQRFVHAHAESGAEWPPMVGQIKAAARRALEPPVPTFDEAFALVFGHGSRVLQGDFTGVPEIVASWASRAGLERLRTLPVFDPEYGELRRAELKRSWEAHVEACAERVLAVRALPPGDRERGLQRMDPLAALGIERPAELGSGS